MTTTSEIELATNQDLPGILNLLESVNVPTEGVDPDFTNFFVVRDDTNNRIIACIGLEIFTGTALLRSFAVDPSHQGNQLGFRLIKRLLDEALDAGSDAVYLCTAKAPKFFTKLGFVGIDLDDVPEEIRNSELFTRICPQVAAFMKKSII